MIDCGIGPDEAGQRFDKYLKKLFKEAPSGFIYKMLRKKNITLNGHKAAGDEKLSIGDAVQFYLSDDTFKKMCGRMDADSYARLAALDYKPYIDVIFEDNDFCFLNKPAGILTQSDISNTPSLNEYFLSYLINNDKLTADSFKTFHPSVSNRLDRNTSGLVLCGKSLSGLSYNARILKDRSLEKHYLALVKGEIREGKKLSGYISKDKKQNKVTIFDEPGDDKVKIETAYTPVEVLCVADESAASNLIPLTLLDIHLITGRTHQIRAHLASEKHPIVGDYKYGDAHINEIFRARVGLKYQLLHSHSMTFPDKRTFTAPLPFHFKKALDLAKEYK